MVDSNRSLAAFEAPSLEGFEGTVPPTFPGLEAFGEALVKVATRVTGEDIEGRIRDIVVHPNAIGWDPFGFDPHFARYALAVAALLHRRYFRTVVRGIEKLPEGRVLVIANHSGQVPLDGVIIGAAMLLDAKPPRFPRSMVEKWTAELPFVSTVFPRCGQVVGAPDNARRLLQQEEALIVFPEGAKGISKTYDRRYQLTEFGLGFMRLALETKTPIVPVAVIGAEEQYPSMANVKPVADLLGMPSFPFLPQLLLGMPFPLPTKYRLTFGSPMTFEGDADDDDAVVEAKVWAVKTEIASMLKRGLEERESVFF